MDDINKNKNSPTDAPIDLLLPQTTISTIHGIVGWGNRDYATFFSEHLTNVHLNDREPFNINSAVWSRVYSNLNDLKYIIDRGSDNGLQEGHYIEVGIAKILYVLTLSVGTDLFGAMPHSESLQGSLNRTPAFDSQEEIYLFLQDYLDEAIVDLDKGSFGNTEDIDLIFSGNKDMWKRTAFALKARFYNRLSNIDPVLSSESALDALDNTFSSEDEGLIFTGYLSGSTNNNPWSDWQKTEQTWAVSETIINVMNSFMEDDYVDPRAKQWFSKINGEFVGAPPGLAETDQTHTIYSAPLSNNILFDEADQPVITFDEMKFIEAEALLRLDQRDAANEAYEEAVIAAFRRANISESEIAEYIEQNDV